YCVFLGDNLLSWSAKRQVTLSRSSAEAEYHGVTNVVAETAWIQNLLLELHALLTTATLVYYDNVSAVYLSTNLVQHQRTKYIEIDIHFVRDYVASGQVHVLHVPRRREGNDERIDDINGQGNDQGLEANGGVEGVNRNVEGVNGGVGGAPDFSTIIAQQLQNHLPAMLAKICMLSREVVFNMSWNDFKFMMIEEFCPSHEMQKLETKL
nr:NBS-containing resistance-like protein [Tanacetum cinerariifolium]